MPYIRERRRVRRQKNNIAAETGTLNASGWGSGFNIAEEMAQHQGKVPNVGTGKVMIGDKTAHFDENGVLMGATDIGDYFPPMQHFGRQDAPRRVEQVRPKMEQVLVQHYEQPRLRNRFLDDPIPIVIDDEPQKGRWDRTIIPFNPGGNNAVLQPIQQGTVQFQPQPQLTLRGFQGQTVTDIEARSAARKARLAQMEKEEILFQTGWVPKANQTFGKGHGLSTAWHEAQWAAVKKVPDDMYAGFGTSDVVDPTEDLDTGDYMDRATYVDKQGNQALDPLIKDPGNEGAITEDYYLFGPAPGEGLIKEWDAGAVKRSVSRRAHMGGLTLISKPRVFNYHCKIAYHFNYYFAAAGLTSDVNYARFNLMFQFCGTTAYTNLCAIYNQYRVKDVTVKFTLQNVYPMGNTFTAAGQPSIYPHNVPRCGIVLNNEGPGYFTDFVLAGNTLQKTLNQEGSIVHVPDFLSPKTYTLYGCRQEGQEKWYDTSIAITSQTGNQFYCPWLQYAGTTIYAFGVGTFFTYAIDIDLNMEWRDLKL